MTQNARQLPARSTDCIVAGCTAAADKRLDLSYAFDKNANVSQITDNIDGRQTRGMSYDGLDRLTQTTSNMFGTATYVYDVLDNLTQVNVASGTKARNHFYCYDASWRLGNVKTTSCSGATVVGLSYDVQGNLANKNGQAFNFDYGNRLRAATGVETYRYDGHGRRIESRTSTYAEWQYSSTGQLMFSHDARNNKATNYVYLGGSLVALREKPLSGGTETLKYQHTDALGSPIAVTDAGKAFLEKTEYEPYGQVVNGTLKDGPGYTGHVLDAATGMNYMQERYFDPMLGRMLSRDPVTAYDNGDIRFFNAYAYAFNNPYRFTDPDGRQASGEDPAERMRHEEERRHEIEQMKRDRLQAASNRFNGVDSSGGPSQSEYHEDWFENVDPMGNPSGGNEVGGVGITTGVAGFVALSGGAVAYEGVAASATAGTGTAALRTGLDKAFRYTFGKGGILNKGQNFRIGIGRDGGKSVFRIGGKVLEKVPRALRDKLGIKEIRPGVYKWDLWSRGDL